MNSVLIIADKDDPHAQAVSDFASKKADVIWFDSFTFSTDVSITFKSENGASEAYLKLPNQSALKMSEISGIFYRDYSPPNFPDGMDEKAYAVFCSEHADTFWGSLRLAKNAKWINHPVYQEELLLKLNQLQVANELGLETPPTIVTNEPVEAIIFYNSYPEVICKLLSHDFYGYEPEDELAVYTSLVDESTLQMYVDDISKCPTMFQARTPKSMDIRVNVVGDKVFTAAIFSQDEPESCVDFRLVGNLTKLQTVSHVLPKHIEQSCINMLKKYNLNFGAFDFSLTPDGRYVFFEVNLIGNWLWLEEMVGLGISEAIADLLTS